MRQCGVHLGIFIGWIILRHSAIGEPKLLAKMTRTLGPP